MFKLNKSTTPELDTQITNVTTHMATLTPWSPEYTAMAANLETLYNAKSKIDNGKVSPDAKLAFVGHLAGLGLIMKFERLHVLSTKALGFVTKLK